MPGVLNYLYFFCFIIVYFGIMGDFQIMGDFLIMGEFWIMWGRGTSRFTNTHTDRHTHQYHDSTWPRGLAHWKKKRKKILLRCSCSCSFFVKCFSMNIFYFSHINSGCILCTTYTPCKKKENAPLLVQQCWIPKVSHL